MKKKNLLLSGLLLSVFLTGCNNELESKTKDVSSDEIDKMATEIQPTKEEDVFIEVTGVYSYYIETDNSVAPYRKTVLNRVCFEPAQMETVNDGQLFCFGNTQEALDILKIKKTDDDCRKYWGTAEIKIKDLISNNASKSKTDVCIQNGSCNPSEAELVEVVKLYGDVSKCSK